MTPLSYGTSYFFNMVAAIRYYCPYEPNCTWRQVAIIVEEKVKRGEIHLGKPPLKEGETCFLIDSQTRWAIREPRP